MDVKENIPIKGEEYTITTVRKNSDDDSDIEFWMEVLQVGLYVLFGLIIFWMVISRVPMFTYHQHTNSCYGPQEELICTKEEGELVLKENPIPGPLELIEALEEIE